MKRLINKILESAERFTVEDIPVDDDSAVSNLLNSPIEFEKVDFMNALEDIFSKIPPMTFGIS